jgi:hypothetical protein
METNVALRYRTEVFCTTQIEGTHNWPSCPYDEVDYLRVPHRHVFHIKAYKPVTHSDRDVEFIMLKHQIRNYLIKKYGRASQPADGGEIHYYHCEFGAMSCEMEVDIIANNAVDYASDTDIAIKELIQLIEAP